MLYLEDKKRQWVLCAGKTCDGVGSKTSQVIFAVVRIHKILKGSSDAHFPQVEMIL